MKIQNTELNTQIKEKRGTLGFYGRIQTIFNKPTCQLFDYRNNRKIPSLQDLPWISDAVAPPICKRISLGG